MNVTFTDKTDVVDGSGSRAAPAVTLSVDGVAVLQAFEANTFLSRLRGLHAYLPINDNEALIIRPCSAVHSFTMPAAIDTVFVSASGEILEVKTLPVRRWCSVSGAVAVIETNADVCQRLGIRRGAFLSRDTGVWK